MSKPKKPAEDKYKAGAVTNSIAGEVNEILAKSFNLTHDIGLKKLSNDWFWVTELRDDDFERIVGHQKSNVNKQVHNAKSALLTLIADRERKARINELKSMVNAEIVKPEYHNLLVGKITALQAEEKG